MLDSRKNNDHVEHPALGEVKGDDLSRLEAGRYSTLKDDSDSETPSPRQSVKGGSSGASQRTGRWTPDEKILFLYGLKRFGKGRWKKMSIYLPHR